MSRSPNELTKKNFVSSTGTISHEEAKQKAIAEFEKCRKLEMLQYESDYDRAIRELVEKEQKLIGKGGDENKEGC